MIVLCFVGEWELVLMGTEGKGKERVNKALVCLVFQKKKSWFVVGSSWMAIRGFVCSLLLRCVCVKE